MSTILVTGAAGFIGFHLARRLLELGHAVTGIDNLNPYYDVGLKQARLAVLQAHSAFSFRRLDLADRSGMAELFRTQRFQVAINLAAQAGVRYSLENPYSYIDSNLVGFGHVLEGAVSSGVEHLIFASSSSVYGANTTTPFSVHHGVSHPLSLYAATKQANEAMAHAYSHLHRLPVTGLRFFTVYGPWGRPDMAIFLFTRAILAGEPINIFNHGNMERDFTYIDDIVAGIIGTLNHPPLPDPDWSGATPDPASSNAPYRLYNIGNHQAVSLLELVELLERELGRPALKRFLPMQPGDVPTTCAEISDLTRAVGFIPATPLREGVARFVAWYREYTSGK